MYFDVFWLASVVCLFSRVTRHVTLADWTEAWKCDSKKTGNSVTTWQTELKKLNRLDSVTIAPGVSSMVGLPRHKIQTNTAGDTVNQMIVYQGLRPFHQQVHNRRIKRFQNHRMVPMAMPSRRVHGIKMMQVGMASVCFSGFQCHHASLWSDFGVILVQLRWMDWLLSVSEALCWASSITKDYGTVTWSSRSLILWEFSCPTSI